MKIRFRSGDQTFEGETRDLTTLGTFVLTDQRDHEGDLLLALLIEGDPLQLKGEVVQTTEEGIAVAFHALPLDTLERLDLLLNGEGAGTAEPATAGPPPSPQLAIQGLDWNPPVVEPVLHEWRPETDFTQPPPEGSTASSWAALPTITAGSQVQPPTPEEQAAQFLSGSQQAPAEPEAPPPAAESVPAPAEETSGEDLRLSERHDRSIPVAFENLTGLIKEFTHNISYGGMFVHTNQDLPEKSETAVTLVHPVHGERLTLLARVVHASRSPTPDPATGGARFGLGLEFRMPLDELKRVLSGFIGSHQQAGDSPSYRQIVVDARNILNRGASSMYALLGLRDGAPLDAVRQAYFKLVDRFHPDRYFGKVAESDRKVLEELFRRLTKAYEELTA